MFSPFKNSKKLVPRLLYCGRIAGFTAPYDANGVAGSAVGNFDLGGLAHAKIGPGLYQIRI
jgi:hypothetical protein